MKKIPPFSVTLATALVLSLSAWSIFRVWTAVIWRDVLAEFASRPGPLYIGVTGAIWSILGLAVLWGIGFRKSWALRLLFGGALAFSAWYWTDRLLLQTERANWPFTLAFNLLAFIPIFLSTRTNHFTKEREHNEREFKDQGTTRT